MSVDAIQLDAVLRPFASPSQALRRIATRAKQLRSGSAPAAQRGACPPPLPHRPACPTCERRCGQPNPRGSRLPPPFGSEVCGRIAAFQAFRGYEGAPSQVSEKEARDGCDGCSRRRKRQARAAMDARAPTSSLPPSFLMLNGCWRSCRPGCWRSFAPSPFSKKSEARVAFFAVSTATPNCPSCSEHALAPRGWAAVGAGARRRPAASPLSRRPQC